MTDLNAKVLILEEDLTVGRELKLALEELGSEVVLLRDGRTGLARAVTDRFDAILLSAELPVMNGFRVCKRIKEDASARTTPLFMLFDASQTALDSHRQLPTRADYYVKRPVVVSEIVAGIRNALPRAPNEAAPPASAGRAEAPLAKALDDAEGAATTVVELRRRMNEQEATIARLTSELAAARAGAPPMLAGVPRPVPRPAAAATDPELKKLRSQLAEQAEELRKLSKAGGAAEELQTELSVARKEHARSLAAMKVDLERAREEAAADRAALERDLGEERKLRSTTEAALARATMKVAAADSSVVKADEKIEALERGHDKLLAELAKVREELRSVQVARDGAVDARRRAESALGEAGARAIEAIGRAERAENEGRGLMTTALERHADDLVELDARYARSLAEQRASYEAALSAERSRAEDAVAAAAKAAQTVAEVEARAESGEMAERERAEASRSELRAREADSEALREAHAAALAELGKELAAARAAVEDARRDAREAERRGREREAALDARVSALEEEHAARTALYEKQQQVLESIGRELMEAQTEASELDAEIIVLRGELTNVRRLLDHEMVTGAALEAEVERSRDVLRRARALLGGTLGEPGDPPA